MGLKTEQEEKEMTHWTDHASCKGMDANIFFPEVLGDQKNGLIWEEAKAICQDCPVKMDCLKSELPYEQASGRRNGVWGGLTPKERDQYVRGLRPVNLGTKKP